MGGMRHGIVILPDLRWRDAAARWRAVDEMGFDIGWTYDHMVWSGLPDSPWAAAMPVLAAAAGVTERIRLGTYVSSPNNHHPYAFAREIHALDDISGGRFVCGLGTGGDIDARVLGDDLPLKARVDRFHEFVPLLRRLLREDHVDHEGRFFTTRDARTLPCPTRVPVVVAANGPRSIRLAAEHGDGWATYGGKGETLDAWFAHVASLAAQFADAEAAAGRTGLDRILSLDSSPQFSMASVGVYEEMVGRAAALGFTDIVTHWPRDEGPYAGDVAVLDEVAARLKEPS